MNLPDFIARRIKDPAIGTFSSMIHGIAVINITVGLCIMIISVAIKVGYKKTITDKVATFSGHLEITKYTVSSTYEDLPVSRDSASFKKISILPFIDHIQGVAHKVALIKIKNEIQGVVFKGIGGDYNIDKFKENITKGRFLKFPESGISDEILISYKISLLLNIEVNDQILVYFIHNPVRIRKLRVCGIYDSGMEEFDEKIVFGDIKLIQQLNNWGPGQYGTFEVFVNNTDKLPEYEKKLFDLTDYDLYVDNMRDKYAEIFDWLSLIDRNVTILLVPLISVISFNMISVLIILIMERTQMIGLLKALGATNYQIRRIFWYNGTRLILYGLFWGNLLGIGFGLIQQKFKLIHLDPENYYMRYVPIQWDWIGIASINLLILVFVSLTIYLPTLMISRIQPIRSIRFD